MTFDKKYEIGLYTFEDVYLKNIYLYTGNIRATENIPERIEQVELINKVP